MIVNKLINEASKLPASTPTPFVSVEPILLPVSGRLVDLELRVSAPATGGALPTILLSHGHGSANYLSSMKGCTPLADFWAAHGFVVIQPTHLNSKTLAPLPDSPDGPLAWRSRVDDMTQILDQLDRIEAIPGLGGRLDRGRIAVAGYSMGGHTASMLLGMRVIDPVTGNNLDLRDQRIKAGVLLAAPGKGSDLSPQAAQRFPSLRNNSFAEMASPALVVAGDKDVNPMFTARKDWRADAYHLSPGPKSLLTVSGGEHSLGGVSGYDAAETTDEDPDRVAAVQRLTWAYLRTALYAEDPAWPAACAALADSAPSLGRVDHK